MMVLKNETDFSQKRLEQLSDFVSARCKFPHLAYIRVLPGEAGHVGSGYAFQWNPDFDNVHTPSSVYIYLSRNTYPAKTIHRKAVGEIVLRSWEEEYVFTLAHELRHIDQFWGFEAPSFPEVDAETFAKETLEVFRNPPQPKISAVARLKIARREARAV